MIALAIIAILLAIAAGYATARWHAERAARITLTSQVAAARDDRAEALALATERLGLVDEMSADLADAQADLAAQAAAEPPRSATDDPPAATAGPGEQEGHNFPAPTPIEQAEAEIALDQDHGSDPAPSDEAPEPEPPAALTTDQARETLDVPPLPASDRPLTAKQQALVDAVNRLGEASTSQIAHAVGRDGQAIAVGSALKTLRDLGHVAHNGRMAKGARWLALPGAAVPDAGAQPLTELTDSEAQIVALVVNHGPVSADWIADTLIKNRRETAATMRELARAGWLVDLDGGMFASSPEQAQGTEAA